MQFYNHTLPSGAALVGYLRDETTENARLQHPPGYTNSAGRRLRLVQLTRG